MDQRTILEKTGNSYTEMTVKDGNLHKINPPKSHNPKEFKRKFKGRCLGVGLDEQEALVRFYDDVRAGHIGGDSKYALIEDNSYRTPTGHSGGELNGRASISGIISFLEKIK